MICNEIWIIENERGDICMFAIAVGDMIDRSCWLLSQYFFVFMYFFIIPYVNEVIFACLQLRWVTWLIAPADC